MFDAEIAAIRFGAGLSPRAAAPASLAAMRAHLSGPDAAAARFPIAGFAEILPLARRYTETRSAAKQKAPGGEEAYKAAREALREAQHRSLATQLQRAATADDGFRERLVAFWADHFTVRPRGGQWRPIASAFVEDAIRPHLTAPFATMLRAATLHPAMLLYLDQHQSIGPNSPEGQRRSGGLNENLAREVLELHSLGVGAGYGQDDVRQFAELLTGLSVKQDAGFAFQPRRAEPGPETVLGRVYGSDAPARLDDILEALDDIAARPETARHIASKLAVHFVSDSPEPALVDHLASAFTETGGSLAAVYDALLDHPAAWAPLGAKVRKPFDFIAATLRALDVPAERLGGLGLQEIRTGLIQPLAAMGQPFQAPPGPDGWPEAAEAWITPQYLAARIRWATDLRRITDAPLPDPRALAEAVLGRRATPELLRAVGQAESRREGVGLVLASAAFNRR